MAFFYPSQKKSIFTFAKVLISHQSKRNFKTSIFCASTEKNVSSTSFNSTGQNEIQASTATIIQNNKTPYESGVMVNSPDITSSSMSSIPSSFQAFPESIEQPTKPELASQEKNALPSVWDQINPRTIHRVFYFDSLAFTKRLEQKGFSRDQAEGCVECLLEVIGNTLDHQAKHMITKSEQKIAEQQLHTEIMSVKKDMVLLQKSEFSALRTETEKISNDIVRIQSHFQDELVKLKGQFTLDINLERGRAVEAHAANEKCLQMLDNKIEMEIAHLKTTYEVYRNDIFKYAAGTVLTCTTLIIGFIRLWK